MDKRRPLAPDHSPGHRQTLISITSDKKVPMANIPPFRTHTDIKLSITMEKDVPMS